MSEQRNFINSYHNGVALPRSEETIEYTNFVKEADQILKNTAELARVLTQSHQSAIALIINGDWSQAHKYFSLSEKYSEWADYNAAATGYGIHGYITKEKVHSLNLTQTELVNHPAWRNFGVENGKHPPMRGWLVATLIGSDGLNYGLLQVSDRLAGDFSAEDELNLKRLAQLTSTALDSLAQVYLGEYREKISKLNPSNEHTQDL